MRKLLRGMVGITLFAGMACGSSSSSPGIVTPHPDAGTDARPTVDAPVADTSVSRADTSVPADALLPPADASTIFDAGAFDVAQFKGDAGVVAPTRPGPYTYAATTGSFNSTYDGGGGASVATYVAYPPAGPKPGPYPVIIFAHGFDLSPSQYYDYIDRAASFGYVGMTVDFADSLVASNYVENVADFLGGLNWLESQSNGSTGPLVGLANTQLVGSSGHSLGGKLAILAAAQDSRIKASLVFDPVDGSAMCAGPNLCPNASSVLPLNIPTGFLGETLDSTPAPGFTQACAPANANYTTLYPLASSPSFELTINGAGHLSFLDDISSCVLVCSFCAKPTAPTAEVLGIAETYLVAFYERYLRGDTGYDTYLTGAAANQLFVQTNEATLQSK